VDVAQKRDKGSYQPRPSSSTRIHPPSGKGNSRNFAQTAFSEVGSLDVLLGVLEEGSLLVGASPYTIPRPKWGHAPMTSGCLSP
jgi:hypothetical protein